MADSDFPTKCDLWNMGMTQEEFDSDESGVSTGYIDPRVVSKTTAEERVALRKDADSLWYLDDGKAGPIGVIARLVRAVPGLLAEVEALNAALSYSALVSEAQFNDWLAENNRVVAAKALEDTADEIQFVRVSRIERRSVQWWDGMDDAEQIICARAAALRVQGETKP